MKTLNIGFRICEGRTWSLVLLILLKHSKQTSLLLLYNTVCGMIMRILHGHSACIVNSLVLSQSLTWWIIKNQHSNGNLWHSFEQNILEDIQQTQVNIKHRVIELISKTTFLVNPLWILPIFSQVIFFLAGEFPFLPIQSARLWMILAPAISWCLYQVLGSFSPSISPFFSMISSVFGWFLDDFHLPR